MIRPPSFEVGRQKSAQNWATSWPPPIWAKVPYLYLQFNLTAPLFVCRIDDYCGLLLLRGVSDRKSCLWRSRRSSSFGSPPSFHRGCEVRTAFGREIKLSLRFLCRTLSADVRRSCLHLWHWAASVLLGRRRNRHFLTSPFTRGRGRSTFGLIQSCRLDGFTLPFQPCKFLCTLLKASFEPPNLLVETFKLHKQITMALSDSRYKLWIGSPVNNEIPPMSR